MTGRPSLRERSETLLAQRAPALLPPRFLSQVTHLTVPAHIWRYVEGAVTRTRASLVMLDLEDSIPRGDAAALQLGRDNVVRALGELEWRSEVRGDGARGGHKLRGFRPGAWPSTRVSPTWPTSWAAPVGASRCSSTPRSKVRRR